VCETLCPVLGVHVSPISVRERLEVAGLPRQLLETMVRFENTVTTPVRSAGGGGQIVDETGVLLSLNLSGV
jgi:hypothetical protein